MEGGLFELLFSRLPTFSASIRFFSKKPIRQKVHKKDKVSVIYSLSPYDFYVTNVTSLSGRDVKECKRLL
jgi:hypothetical protein